MKVSSNLHFEKNCKLDTGHPVQYFLLKKNRCIFIKVNFDIFKTYENNVGREYCGGERIHLIEICLRWTKWVVGPNNKKV